MEFFQDDLYPPTNDTTKPVLTADEWLDGKSKGLEKIPLNPQGKIILGIL